MKSTSPGKTKTVSKVSCEAAENGAPQKSGAPRASTILEPIPDFEALFPIRQYLTETGAATPGLGLDPALDPELMRAMMTHMILNRDLDERLTKLQRQGRIGFHIGSIGEEALMIGSAAALEPTDWVVPCYREAGVALYRGMPLEALIANMYGNAEDPVKGRQMPCHYADREHNFLSISSPVGTQITQAAGVAWAAKIKKTNDVALVYFGDGATSQGDFHNGLNFAGVFKAPCVFLCRNNQWAISTPFEVQTASKTLAQKSLAYGIAGERVDGNDLLACHAATRDAITRARSGGGPTLLEMVTYRQGPHSTSDDPRAYRQQSEVDEWIRKDPIERFRKYLTTKGLWSQGEEESIRAEIADRIHRAIERAESAPRPPIASMFSDVFKDVPNVLREQQAELESSLNSEPTGTAHA